MLSPAKLNANRLNAQKSTGPRTADGKSRASLNALKAGMFCDKRLVLPGESHSDYDALRDAISQSIDQDDPFEVLLAEQMVAARWKLARLNTAERRMHAEQSECVSGELDEPVCKLFVKHFEKWEELSRHEQRLENRLLRAMRELRQWRAEKRKRKNEPTEQPAPSLESPVSEQGSRGTPRERQELDASRATVINTDFENEPTEAISEPEPQPADSHCPCDRSPTPPPLLPDREPDRG